ncbi:MAG TPA: hypothetical protein ENF37_05370 [Beggiatoa sp.]|nr:hypothetical protein [Beggiatoa sp.]
MRSKSDFLDAKHRVSGFLYICSASHLSFISLRHKVYLICLNAETRSIASLLVASIKIPENLWFSTY